MARRSAPVLASVLIIAGGRGTRFWPASREAKPKPLFSIDGKTSLLEDTIARHLPLIPRERIFVLAAAAHQAPFRRALRGLIPARNLIVEPEGRNTAVAIAYGAAVIRRRLGEGIIAAVAADHYITPAAGYRRTLADAIRLAKTRDAIVVIGVTPTRAESGYGYEKIGPKAEVGFKVEKFVEKPPPKLARAMVRSGKYLWNPSMFVMSTRTLAHEFAEHCPALGIAAERLARTPRPRLAREYHRLKFDSFDRVIMEKSQNVFGVPARFSWYDVGSWHGLWDAVGGDDGNVIRGNAIALDSERVLAHSDSRLMVLFGVRDLIVVDTGDAILVAHRERSPQVGQVTKELERRGLQRYL
ncbi:MAG: sugar phosphate nucleotidyltransferase [Candidatus Binatus sp.]|jgi:mannose-1-phosphate guanylyltransferase|uniref:mannose-1-phosphate guanylyltransferase n=2 Tax=Candidatus Binatus sp. TaxID=2811406 RepID=UPI003C750859